jgi:hypothetical protein
MVYCPCAWISVSLAYIIAWIHTSQASTSTDMAFHITSYKHEVRKLNNWTDFFVRKLATQVSWHVIVSRHYKIRFFVSSLTSLFRGCSKCYSSAVFAFMNGDLLGCCAMQYFGFDWSILLLACSFILPYHPLDTTPQLSPEDGSNIFLWNVGMQLKQSASTDKVKRVTSRLPVGTEWLTAKLNKIFPTRFKYR